MSITVHCEYCKQIGGLQWFLGFSGRGKGRVASTLEFDHSTAESAGGLSVASNIVLACLKCNRSKGSKPVSEWHQ